jgi:hypothetical protein
MLGSENDKQVQFTVKKKNIQSNETKLFSSIKFNVLGS